MAGCSGCESERLPRLSLEAAVRGKYCSDAEGDDPNALPAHKTIKESAIAFRPGELQDIYMPSGAFCSAWSKICVFIDYKCQRR